MIKKYIDNLPEIYQPVFGHSELTPKSSRGCNDRLAELIKIYDAFEKYLGRPLRILDLGCAQGFFCFQLASRGATVHGVDFLKENIELCNALLDENPHLLVSFEKTKIEDVIASISTDKYDIVVGLSVFHHLIYAHSIPYVQALIKSLADNIPVGIYELALHDEPVYWADSLPKSPDELLSNYSFFTEINAFSTHLSQIKRPLYFASCSMWWLGNQLGKFDSCKIESHIFSQGVHQGTRRYYFGNGLLAKVFELDKKNICVIPNKKEYNNEINICTNGIHGINIPTILLHGIDEKRAWLVRKTIPGELLCDCILNKKTVDKNMIIIDIINEAIILESYGLYHNDIRTWNVLILPNGHATLIDYGSISEAQEDCVWPNNIFIAFLIFIEEVITEKLFPPNPIRFPLVNIRILPPLYRNAFNKFISSPKNTWSFAFLKKCIDQASISDEEQEGYYAILASLEEAGMIYQNTIKNHIDLNNQLASSRQIAETSALNAEKRALSAEAAAQNAEARALSAKAAAQNAEARATHAESKAQAAELALNAIYKSRSWRMTAPYRQLGNVARSIMHYTKIALKPSAAGIFRYVRAHPRIKSLLMPLVNASPRVRTRLKVFQMGYVDRVNILTEMPSHAIQNVTEEDIVPMTTQALKIYQELKREIAKQKERGGCE